MGEHRRIYEKFIHLALAAEELPEFSNLESDEKMILNLLSDYWFRSQPIKVVESINMTTELSPSTMFRHLKKLRKKGYVALVLDELDNRVKYVASTDIADAYFSAMGKLIIQAVN